MEIVMSTQVCLISRMNFGYMENGGKKAFLENPKHQHHVFQSGAHDYCAKYKKNGDYHVNPCLPHLIDEL